MIKQIIIIRRDLKMSLGKAVAQGCHASVQALRQYPKDQNQTITEWVVEGAAKIVLAVDSLDELFDISQKARKAGIATALIADAGRTELEPSTITALGIGPAESTVIDPITQHLKLL